MSNILELVLAPKEQEFFYKEDDISVSEGEPVGVDLDDGQEVKFILFDHIYWNPNYESEEI